MNWPLAGNLHDFHAKFTVFRMTVGIYEYGMSNKEPQTQL